jgi:hypothetical protein
MAIAACQECGGKVSTEAPACPHCGWAPARLTPPPASPISGQQVIHKAGNPIAAGFGGCLGMMLAVVFCIVALGVCVAAAGS